MRRIAITVLAPLALAGCGGGLISSGGLFGGSGTQATFEGEVCGQPVSMSVNDRRDRESFTASAKCGDGGEVSITSAGSATSPVTTADNEAIKDLTSTIRELVNKL